MERVIVLRPQSLRYSGAYLTLYCRLPLVTLSTDILTLRTEEVKGVKCL